MQVCAVTRTFRRQGFRSQHRRTVLERNRPGWRAAARSDGHMRR